MTPPSLPASADLPALSNLSRQFDAADLPGQFILSRSPEAVPAGWRAWCQDGWTLGAHAALPVRAMRARTGEAIGWLAGRPIDARGEWIDADAILDVPADPPGDAFESALYEFGGRFLAVVLTPALRRVYLDSSGSLSAVYAPEPGIVASTPSLVPPVRGGDDRVELMRAGGVPGDETSIATMLAFGLTSRHGVDRLLPNHYLDLDGWNPVRHWPRAPLDDGADPAEAVETVVRVASRHIAAAVSRGGAYLQLTAGYDSRTLLACARERMDRVHLMTLAFADRVGQVDVEVAARLARRAGLAHVALACDGAGRRDFEAWLWRTGACIGGARGWQAARPYEHFNPVWPELTGAGGETARASYWPAVASHGRTIDEGVVVDAVHMPRRPEVLERARAWLDHLPATRPMHVVDLVYVEQRMGSWTGIVPYGHAHSVPARFHPFVHRESFTATLRLPDEYKRAKRLPHDIIASRWPELLREPFNRVPGWRHHVYRARRRVWLVRRALAGDRG
jgi:hypothetical protein